MSGLMSSSHFPSLALGQYPYTMRFLSFVEELVLYDNAWVVKF